MPVSARTAADRSAAACKRLLGSGLGLIFMALAGCASLTYTDVMKQVDQDLAAHQPQAALKALDKLSGSGDRTLYLLNKAMVQRMAGDYAGSVQTFEQVKPVLAYLEATSVSETAGALTLSENLRSYAAPLYERLMVHVYEGLDYMQLGQPDSARVEVLQIDDLLKRLYPGADAAPNGGDAFPRYFSGLVYESRGEYSDAMIAYRQAYLAYKAGGVPDAGIPQDLKLSLCRFADYLGLNDERDRYSKAFGLESWPPVIVNDPQGEIVFLLSDGLGPEKTSKGAYLQNPLNGRFYNLTLPVLERRESSMTTAAVTVAGQDARTQRVANLYADATRQLDADRPKLMADEFARNVAREVAANAADRKGQGLGTLLSFVGAIADQADTRIWSMLPDNIQLARLRLAPGSYDVTLRLESGAGPAGTKVLKGVTVLPGQTTFTALQWVSFH